MSKELIILLATSIMIGTAGYLIFTKKFTNIRTWIKINLVIFLFGIGGGYIATSFLHPYMVWRNLQVFSILIVSAFNVFYLIDELAKVFRIGKFSREGIGFLSIFAGTLFGTQLINLIGIAHFQHSDVKDTLLIAFVFNTGRALVNFSMLIREMRKKENELEAVKWKELYAKAQLDLMYAKINPHFLYNSLNAIAGLAMVDGKKTKEMTIALSKLLRYSLNQEENNFSKLKEEVEIIETYFGIEKIRFGENFQYEINLSDEAKQYLIPRYLLQPLVENCIKHAFTGTENKNFIRVNASLENHSIVIVIHDNGRLFPEKTTPGYGLKHVSDKLQLLLPGKYELHFTNTPQKQVKIIINELRTKECSPIVN
jgi:sensor histidine kinase YesM